MTDDVEKLLTGIIEKGASRMSEPEWAERMKKLEGLRQAELARLDQVCPSILRQKMTL